MLYQYSTAGGEKAVNWLLSNARRVACAQNASPLATYRVLVRMRCSISSLLLCMQGREFLRGWAVDIVWGWGLGFGNPLLVNLLATSMEDAAGSTADTSSWRLLMT